MFVGIRIFEFAVYLLYNLWTSHTSLATVGPRLHPSLPHHHCGFLSLPVSGSISDPAQLQFTSLCICIALPLQCNFKVHFKTDVTQGTGTVPSLTNCSSGVAAAPATAPGHARGGHLGSEPTFTAGENIVTTYPIQASALPHVTRAGVWYPILDRPLWGLPQSANFSHSSMAAGSPPFAKHHSVILAEAAEMSNSRAPAPSSAIRSW